MSESSNDEKSGKGSSWLDGDWKGQGTSEKKKGGKTFWMDMSINIKDGIIQGKGTSFWGDHQIPFSINGKVHKKTVSIIKTHESFIDNGLLIESSPFSYDLLATISGGHLFLYTCGFSNCVLCSADVSVTLFFS